MKISKTFPGALSIIIMLICCTYSSTAQWKLLGNSATNPAINFLGTTDLQPLKFRINNVPAGELNPVNGNTALGINTLLSNTIGTGNVAIGTNALYHNIRGRNLVAIGDSALFSYSAAFTFSNTAIGSKALFSTTSGYRNTATGYQTLYSNIKGYDNTAIGSQALYSNTTIGSTTGNNNTAIGSKALYGNTVGVSNTASGAYALTSNTSGSGNTANGAYALYVNNTGVSNTAMGYQSLYTNTTGQDNTASGYQALYNNNSNRNSSTGYQALYSNTSGIGNTAFGYNCLYLNTTGNENTAIGLDALFSNSTGSSIVAIGPGADVTNDNLSNSIVIGYGAQIAASNEIRLGNYAITSIGGQVDWSFTSDVRVKKNIKANVPGLTFISKLQPVTFNFDLDAMDKIAQRPTIKVPDSKSIESNPEQLASRKAKEQIVYTGFIAQDVEKAAKELNYDFSGVDAAKNDKDLYGLRYAEFVVPLVKAVQELSTQNDELKKEVEDLKTTVQALVNANLQPTSSSTLLSAALLEQNVPNPFNQSTTIRYTLPAKFNAAQIVITDQAGKVLKQVNISSIGNGMLNIQAGSLTAGTYNYSLIVDGRLVDSKKMVLIK